MNLSFLRLWGILLAGVFFAPQTHASNHEYYRGKTVRIVVGLSAGGGFDIYARHRALQNQPGDFGKVKRGFGLAVCRCSSIFVCQGYFSQLQISAPARA